MDYSPKITVITVCFNAKDVLENTIKSVVGQTYADYEYLIIDGGSNDGSIEIILQYATNPHVRWISEPDKGIYDAMNKGIKMAKGEWLNFMNAGDCYVNESVLSNIFRHDYPSEVKFLYSDNYYIDEKEKETYAVHDHRKLSILHQSSIYRKELHGLCGQYVVTPKIIVSDLLFFASVPEAYFKKVDVPISRNLIGGVSSNGWCVTQALCVKVVFRKLSFSQMLMHYISSQLKIKFPIIQVIQNKMMK